MLPLQPAALRGLAPDIRKLTVEDHDATRRAIMARLLERRAALEGTAPSRVVPNLKGRRAYRVKPSLLAQIPADPVKEANGKLHDVLARNLETRERETLQRESLAEFLGKASFKATTRVWSSHEKSRFVDAGDAGDAGAGDVARERVSMDSSRGPYLAGWIVLVDLTSLDGLFSWTLPCSIDCSRGPYLAGWIVLVDLTLLDG